MFAEIADKSRPVCLRQTGRGGVSMMKLRILILIFGDAIAAYLALFIALYIRYGANFYDHTFAAHIFHFSVIYIIWFFIFIFYGFYGTDGDVRSDNFLKNYTMAIITAFGAAVFYFYVQTSFNIISPKTFLVIDAGVFFVLSALWRKLLFSWIWRKGLVKNVVIIGLNENAKNIIREIKNNKQSGYKILFIVNTEEKNNADEFDFVKIIRLSDFHQSINAGNSVINLAVIAVDLTNDKRALDELFSILSFRKIEFINIFSFYENLTGRILLEPLSKVWFLENVHYSGFYSFSKRLFDLVAGVIIGFLFIIILPLTVLAIKINGKGPIFYRQSRVGLRNKSFALFKFRTMVCDAENNGPMFAQINDKRVTKIGLVLRKLRLDELPQFVNIIKGEMSLVGPRPERRTWIEIFETEIPFHKERSLVKPGLTGWAQVNWQYSSSIETMKTRLQYDLYYIKNRSFLLDLVIIFKTIKIVLAGRGR